MQHQSLYRKYRPNTFDEVVGQQVVINTLKNAIVSNMLSHAYVFCGPRGTGKTSVAKIFAKTVNCLDIQNGVSCEKCSTCQMYNNMESPDIIEIDAASNNGVDEIRELKNNTLTLPSASKFKIYIIDEVHMLSTNAFNALLKTLEEPPGHIIFILATTEVHKLPLTILSRCQRFNFENLPQNLIVDRLTYISNQENINIDLEAIKLVAQYGNGALRDSISLLDQLSSYNQNNICVNDITKLKGILSSKELLDLIINISNNNIKLVFDKIECYYTEGNNFFKITEQLLYLLKDELLKQKINSDSNLLINTKTMFDMINTINQTLIIMKENSDYKVQFEIMMLKISELFSIDDFQNIKQCDKITSQEKPIKKEQETVVTAKKTKEKLIPDNIDEIFTVRINNILMCAEKKELLKFQKDWKSLEEDLLLYEEQLLIPILVDSEIRAISNEGIVISFSNQHDYQTALTNYYEIQKYLKAKYKKMYQLVFVTNSDWKNIREKYVIKIKNKEKMMKLEEPKEEYHKEANLLNEFSELIEIERG